MQAVLQVPCDGRGRSMNGGIPIYSNIYVCVCVYMCAYICVRYIYYVEFVCFSLSTKPKFIDIGKDRQGTKDL